MALAVLAIVFLGIVAVPSHIAPSVTNPTAAQTPESRGLIVGTVVDALTGKPVIGAIVAIADAPPAVRSDPPQVMTDAGGRYLFHSLPQGLYRLRVNASGYAPGGYGQTAPNGRNQAIVLADNDATFGDMTIRLWKNASITGVATDEAGEPLVGIQVRAFERTFANGTPRLRPTGTGTTDDRGIYRIANLTPGEYVVGMTSSMTTVPNEIATASDLASAQGGSALTDFSREMSSVGLTLFSSSRGTHVGDFVVTSGFGSGINGLALPPPRDDGRLITYPTAFYPAASNVLEATVLSLGASEDRAAVDLQTRLTPTSRISGTVIGPAGPLAHVGVKLLMVADDLFVSDLTQAAATVTDLMGAFTLFGVTPGQYTLKVSRTPRVISSAPPAESSLNVEYASGSMMGGTFLSSAPLTNGRPAPPQYSSEPTISASMPLVVSSDDVADITVDVRPGARLSGRIVFEGAKPVPASAQLARAVVSLVPTGARPAAPPPSVRVDPTAHFVSGSVAPGTYQISANLPVVPDGVRGWIFKSATLNGRDLADEPLIVGTADVPEIVVTFIDHMITQIDGVVRDARGRLDATASVIAFPVDALAQSRGVTNARRLQNARVTLSAAYRLASLPPGDYYLLAVTGDSTVDPTNPKSLEALSRIAGRVHLVDGDQKHLDLVSRSVQ